ncbi:uncharacterized protein LOC134206628 [Armigeres subalbatus]|uniref:uncharacterized protein LOC134206628 n=1 Tax=Armigeres subalbatus TaxID=124917 RepID=UPI002ED3BBDC
MTKPVQKSHAASANPMATEIACDFCGGSHRNYQCSTFTSLPTSQKREKVRSAGLCYNCLRKGHLTRSCSSSKSCRKCNARHHTILHEDVAPLREPVIQPKASVMTNASTRQDPSIDVPETHLPVDHQVSTSCSSYLPTSSNTVLLLNHARDYALVKIRSKVTKFYCSLECLVTPKVTGKIPTSKIDVNGWRIPEGVVLADPAFHTPDKVDMLIGGELFFDILKPRHLSLSDKLPQLRETHLGWIVAGVIKEPYVSNTSIQHSNVATIEKIESEMQRFWQIEELPNIPKLSREEVACESHFLSTYKRNSTGRFVVQQSFKPTVTQLDDCRDLALKRFLMLEKRLLRNPSLQAQYVSFIREYEELNHCHQLSESNDPPNQQNYYLPHHAVLRPSSSSTKCRVVFDASAKSYPSNLSLNDVLFVGPVVQSELFSIMLRFRTHKIAFTADISKMYRQILITPEHQHYQRIFWREQVSDPLRVLELDTVTYGTASAPYQATRCLAQLAEEERDEYPIAARIITREVYMDDMLSGAETVSEAIEAQRQLKQLLARGGFPIHKWCSNSLEFLQQVPPEERETQVSKTEYEANKTIKVLGLLWDPDADTLLLANQIEYTSIAPITKRVMYAEIAKFYDPLGLFSPAIVLAKLHAQNLWKIKVGWDDQVDEQCAQQWQELQRALSYLHKVQVPRCVISSNVMFYELHGFSDASSVAYGACVYIRSIFLDKTATMSLLTSKSKLAPLHDLSIPRKELCGALLLTRLIKKVIAELKMEFQEIVLWCDSTIVLAWIKKPLNELKLFVRNRITVIQDETNNFRWEYISSENNPADIVSRGQIPRVLEANRLWWQGPDFLGNGEYVVLRPEAIPDDDLPDMNAVVSATINVNDGRTGRILTVPEIRSSTETILKVIQHIHLGDEIQRVVRNESCKRIGNLRPIFLDRSILPFESRHPIILPDKDLIVWIMILEMHIELLHIGQTGLINALRQRYWLLNARSTIRQITRRCVKCFRSNPTDATQLMGNLPTSRVVPSPPFAVTDVDYAGPFWIKQGLRRPALVKAYIAVYVCMATKAVHLEAVSELNTNAFLACLRRFISRRGCIQQLHSDNATNFKGANNEMHELYNQFRSQQAVQRIEQFCHAREIEWHFIPADAPEFGGLWEAAVKSAKTHLKRIVGNVKLTFEEFATVLAEIEAVLNSRPLFVVSNDPADPLVITPAHYLIGRPLTAMAEPSLEDLNANRLDRWQHLQLLREHFWRAWSRDYLNTLQPRKKNLRTMPNIRTDMVVLLHDRNQPPLYWKLGRISAVYPGDDGLVRAVDVVADGSTYRRPITKISVLPIEDNHSDPVPAVEVTQPGGGGDVRRRTVELPQQTGTPLIIDDVHSQLT